jgi:formyltetrahydrofolate synthetase
MNTSTTDTTNEVARLKEMVINAAKRGDELAEHWKERAEKAEAIIKQLHNFAETIDPVPTQSPTQSAMPTE